MTLKKLIELAVSGLKQEYLSPQEQSKIVNYILDNSTLAVTKNTFNLESASILGVGKDIAEKPIPDYRFISFFWSDLYPETESIEGLPAREWFLVSHRNLEHMERMLIARAYDDKDNDFLKGEMIVLINGELQEYKIQSEPLNADDSLAREYVEWVGIKPYQISYAVGTENITETYSSQYQTELRVLQLLRDKAEGIHVVDILTERELHFSVNRLVYDTRPLPGDCDLNIMWHPWEVLDFN
nr:hypothetical protein [uncultured Lachnoclostridium sp.]